MRHWKIAGLSAAAVAAITVYALDSGIYVGSNFYVRGATCCPEQDEVIKYCRYLFITGTSEIPAGNGIRTIPGERKRNEAMAAGIPQGPRPEPPDQGYCRIFGSNQAGDHLLSR